jgi:acyl-CoA thioesterase I
VELRLRALAIAAVLAIATPVEAMTLNIVAIGASNTWGLGVFWDNAYPAVLQRLLREKGIDANVTNAGVLLDRTGWMLRRLDSAVPEGIDIVILQPGANDLRFFGTKEQRAANITAMMNRLHARGIRVIVYDPEPIPPDAYQWDRIHFNAEAHAKIAARLAAQITAPANPRAARSAEIISQY